MICRQELNLVSVKNITEKIVMKSVEMKHLQHELPEHDLTQGRGAPDKNTIFKSVSQCSKKSKYIYRLCVVKLIMSLSFV